ncbi:hypothetical protein WA158_001734, partial [Blastocystis sp. Blastoise]
MFRRSIIVFITLLLCVFAEKPLLHVDQNGFFKVVQFTDHHCAQRSNDTTTYEAMKNVISIEKPDFAAITGDMVGGAAWDKTKGWFEKQWKLMTRVYNEYKLYYGYVLGNHDSEADLSREEVMQLDMTHPFSMSKLGPKDIVGASNFIIPVYEYNSTTKYAFIMYFFDSMRDTCMGVRSWGCVELETIDWYYKKSQEIEKQQGHVVPAIAFLHIPPQEFMTAWNDGKPVGYKYDWVNCPPQNSGLFAAMKKRNDVVGIYAGHDHSSDFAVTWQGIQLAYGRKTGKSVDSPPEFMKIGGRVINIRSHRGESIDIDTYIRNIDGEKEIQTKPDGYMERQNECERG